ncbi:amphi-Trp domain-containing protein [Halolamina sp. CBA1230]|uniref:amphi-Trp domain-containing protein n=1 Tax=Halolamina sp. CBA1230 TaxID=1853690 RepID=UPI0009A14727|nr:amphi-Trp domain-containing protein [Halolamina sp. CBA1230]QKY20176.1 amphi-Trp domain-containing protein [Halolamina sp. CBA1230]
MPEVPTEEADEPTVETITDGYFEEEYYVDAEDAGEFLVELGEQFDDDDEITLTGDDWELPFAFGEPVKLDIEFEGDGEPELEIEVELSGRIEDEAPELS